jgi:tRNA (cytidine/uridine-2'-O-)-methyltransferase
VPNEPSLNVVLYQPEIPQNTGNVGRTCLAIGAKLWLVRPLGFRVDEKSLRRAGLDYWQHLDWEAVDQWGEVEQRLRPQRPWFYSKSATRLYTDVKYQAGDVLVFGNEDSGLPNSIRHEYSDRLLRIPIQPPVRSLNLASAVAVVVFEAVRQWGQDT